MYEKFLVDIDDCTFLTSYSVDEPRNITSPSVGMSYAFDKPEPASVHNFISIKIERVVNGIKYEFLSRPIPAALDVIKMRLVFKKDIYLVVNNLDVSDYYFEV